jgi:hypothetical protein
MTVVMASRRRAIWAEYIERNNYVRREKTVLRPDAPKCISVNGPELGRIRARGFSQRRRDQKHNCRHKCRKCFHKWSPSTNCTAANQPRFMSTPLKTGRRSALHRLWSISSRPAPRATAGRYRALSARSFPTQPSGPAHEAHDAAGIAAIASSETVESVGVSYLSP